MYETFPWGAPDFYYCFKDEVFEQQACFFYI